jgi:hypothetical protein
MGMGFGMANMMMNNLNQQHQQSNTAAPPPIPGQIKFFVVINNQQAGPYDLNILKQMITQNQITRETMVWKEGMQNWTSAGSVNELSVMFGLTPPPIPQP